MNHTPIRVGITMGDPSGIGPETIPAALRTCGVIAEFCVIGDRRIFEKAGGGVPRAKNISFEDLRNVPIRGFAFGRVRRAYGKASLEYLDRALEMLESGMIDSLVTCSVSKESAGMGSPGFSGQTEYLAQYSGTREYAMMLLNRSMRITLATRHIPLQAVPERLTTQALSTAVTLTHASLKQLFAIPRPRLVACGLNPHASDNGLIGKEENRLIKPFFARLGKKGIRIDGPLSADVAFSKAFHGEYDAVIAMYHDQALIPLKLSGNETGVNMTLGLPFIRTSPLHGTAFDIAGKGLASADSLIAAIRLAAACSRNRQRDAGRPARRG